MSVTPTQHLPAGYGLFARYAFPPNELGYCGPADSDVLLHGDNPDEIAAHARGFDGAWPYLRAIADATGSSPLAVDIVGSYWVGGPLLARVDPEALLAQLRSAFTGQVTGLLDEVAAFDTVLANHSFHVFVVYPWIRFLQRNPQTALHVLQSCRIRWGTVQKVEHDHVVVNSRPLVLCDGALRLGRASAERIRWSRDGTSLIEPPAPGDIVSAHWDWVCDVLSPAQAAALSDATHTTLHLVNELWPHTAESKGGRQ